MGTDTFSGGLHIVDISDPTNPTAMGSFAADGYTHDAQVVSYAGPDAEFSGKEIAFCFNENTLTIVDVTDATDPALISATGYSNSAYTHQGWLTEDHKYVLLGDELAKAPSTPGPTSSTFRIWTTSPSSGHTLGPIRPSTTTCTPSMAMSTNQTTPRASAFWTQKT